MSAIILRPVETPADEFDRRAINDRLIRFLFKHLFEQDARLRALEGKPATPEAAFRAQIKQSFGQ